MNSPRHVQVRQRILSTNQAVAEDLRSRFAREGTLSVNLISAPGSGKTSLLEASVGELNNLRLGVLEGDIATERDAERIRRLGIPAHQILTGGACHLDARLVRSALETAAFPPLDMLFVENVGNLICPTPYDLGEDFKVVLLSIAEGDDKPFKYPGIFARAMVSVISKIDLLPHLEFDLNAVEREIRRLNPQTTILECSAKTGTGIDQWCKLLRKRLAAKRSTQTNDRS
jgi:hydrogenase nickel incorporation protein HypB